MWGGVESKGGGGVHHSQVAHHRLRHRAVPEHLKVERHRVVGELAAVVVRVEEHDGARAIREGASVDALRPPLPHEVASDAEVVLVDRDDLRRLKWGGGG